MGFKKWLENQVAGAGSDSLAVKMRRKRMDEFERFFYECFKEKMDRREKITILDLGGTYRYWDSVGFKYKDCCSITLLNIVAEQLPKAAWGGIAQLKEMLQVFPNTRKKALILCSAIA